MKKQVLPLSIILVFLMFSGCMQTHECSLPIDCEGKNHDACAGDWICINGMCGWRCMEIESQEPLINESKTECVNDTDCLIGGCNGQFCATKAELVNITSTCEWELKHECLKKTSCDCINGSCSWRITDEYLDCMLDYQVNESRFHCETSEDCVPESCCHAEMCVNKRFQPDCFNVSCSMSCESILDCNQGECACFGGECVVFEL